MTTIGKTCTAMPMVMRGFPVDNYYVLLAALGSRKISVKSFDEVDRSHHLAAAASFRSNIVLRGFDWDGNGHRINPSTNVMGPEPTTSPKGSGS